MAGLHTWTGLLPGWAVFLVFLFGTATFFDQEIDRWMQPEPHAAPVSAQALDAADALLVVRGAGGSSQTGEATLDPVTGHEVAVRDTRGGGFLYAFHYNLYYMRHWLGNYFFLIASLAMLSGIVTHKKMGAIAIAVFHAPNVSRAWLCLAGAAVTLSVLSWLLLPGVVR